MLRVSSFSLDHSLRSRTRLPTKTDELWIEATNFHESVTRNPPPRMRQSHEETYHLPIAMTEQPRSSRGKPWAGAVAATSSDFLPDNPPREVRKTMRVRAMIPLPRQESIPQPHSAKNAGIARRVIPRHIGAKSALERRSCLLTAVCGFYWCCYPAASEVMIGNTAKLPSRPIPPRDRSRPTFQTIALHWVSLSCVFERVWRRRTGWFGYGHPLPSFYCLVIPPHEDSLPIWLRPIKMPASTLTSMPIP